MGLLVSSCGAIFSSTLHGAPYPQRFAFAPGSKIGRYVFMLAVLIHLVAPALGAVLYLHLQRRIRGAALPRVLEVRLFLLSFTYGGWLMVVLTGLFWFWSGVASLTMVYLLLIAPFPMLWTAVKSFPERNRSTLHRVIFWASALYLPAILALIAATAVAMQNSRA